MTCPGCTQGARSNIKHEMLHHATVACTLRCKSRLRVLWEYGMYCLLVVAHCMLGGTMTLPCIKRVGECKGASGYLQTHTPSRQ
jgi:hypothetical protein